jgi:hypothetical protein
LVIHFYFIFFQRALLALLATMVPLEKTVFPALQVYLARMANLAPLHTPVKIH